jgi:hypothetical protein
VTFIDLDLKRLRPGSCSNGIGIIPTVEVWVVLGEDGSCEAATDEETALERAEIDARPRTCQRNPPTTEKRSTPTINRARDRICGTLQSRHTFGLSLRLRGCCLRLYFATQNRNFAKIGCRFC